MYGYDRRIHEPPFLKVIWGSFSYKGRFKTLDIEYTLFNVFFFFFFTIEALSPQVIFFDPETGNLTYLMLIDLPVLTIRLYLLLL